MTVERHAATLPGYASVSRASEVLHLAQRSVRDLIYTGRLPSLRAGRLHYIKASDLELERRRRLGLPARQRRTARKPRAPRERQPARPRQQSLDAELRRQRAAERAALVSRWAQRHGVVEPHVPARVVEVTAPDTCEVCGRTVRGGRMLELIAEHDATGSRLCLTCGRRALLDWADRRRLEAAAARRLSHSLGEPHGEPGSTEPAPPVPAPDIRAA